jgi:hypothetical protein
MAGGADLELDMQTANFAAGDVEQESRNNQKRNQASHYYAAFSRISNKYK